MMKRIVEQNPESYSANNVCGRNKQVEYKGNKLNSSWELLVVEYLDKYNIIWVRNKTGFQYFWEIKNTYHKYFPDFYLPDYNLYLEVKGYETNRDKCKWSVLTNLIIFKKLEIDMIKNGTFNFNKLIKKFFSNNNEKQRS